jgi:hypothetical protein
VVNTSIFGIEIAPVCTKTWCEHIERRGEICENSCSLATRREVRCNSAMTRDSSIFEAQKGGKDGYQRFAPLSRTRKQKGGKNGYQRFDPP